MSRFRRRTIPSAVIALSQVTWPAKRKAAIRRRLGGRGRVELYFAFDDAASAFAVPELVSRLSERRVDLVLLPVVERGIGGDPAREDKRRHAIADATRHGLAVAAAEPVDPQEVASPAAWVAAAEPGPALEAFTCEALRMVWRGERDFDRAWREHVGPGPPPAGAAAVRRNERRMRRRGPYDTPAAVVGGRWYFAHDRSAQIVAWVEELGW